ncbi:MAG: type II toxin-antitoxin system HicA family toxin [Deltaproteobacteria bacterium]
MVVPISRKELIRKFRSLGYSGPFSGGRHQFMTKGKGAQKIRIPNPHTEDIGPALLKEILRQAGISTQEWDAV